MTHEITMWRHIRPFSFVLLLVGCSQSPPPSGTPPDSFVAYELRALGTTGNRTGDPEVGKTITVAGKIWCTEQPKKILLVKALRFRSDGRISTVQSATVEVEQVEGNRYSYTVDLKAISKRGHYVLQLWYGQDVVDEATFQVADTQ